MSTDNQNYIFKILPIWQSKNNPDIMFNARAVRARAGLLNIIIGSTIIAIIINPDSNYALISSILLLFEMVTAATFGLSPISPIGFIATLITSKLSVSPTPHLPKRFAWVLGASLSSVCLIFTFINVNLIWVLSVWFVFFILTWLDSALGFCVGCWMYSKIFGCKICKI